MDIEQAVNATAWGEARGDRRKGGHEMIQFDFADSRPSPNLLFVTSPKALADLGRDEKAALREVLRDHRLLELSATPPDAETAMREVRPALKDPSIEGVVLIGNYDALPARRVRAVDKALAERVRLDEDLDRFRVWNDDIYGDRDHDPDGLPELPVSRIPCPCGPIRAVLQTTSRPAGPERAKWGGIRGKEWDFAQHIFDQLRVDRTLLVSPPKRVDARQPDDVVRPEDLVAHRLYVMLHGLDADATKFRGSRDKTGDQPDAMDLTCVPDSHGTVVLAGCCWGAVTKKEGSAVRTHHNSIALRFLADGARAFIGFTAAHYLPTQPPYGHYAGPLHDLFWRHYDAGSPPALALFKAKRDYIVNVPHRNPKFPGAVTACKSLAIEMKIFWSATCLGLGW